MAAIPPITGIAEIVLSVRDLPAVRQFYVDVLGFPVHSEICLEQVDAADPEGDATISFLTIRELQTPIGPLHPQLLVLIDYQRHAFARERFTGHNLTTSTLNHLAFEIPPDSYDAHLARLQSLDLNPREMVFPDMNARAIFIADPEGNDLELICAAL